jgi:hypothetical protein
MTFAARPCCRTRLPAQLTRLLEDSLGGNSKCVMIVNVSPAYENVSETKCSLEFASRARKVRIRFLLWHRISWKRAAPVGRSP